MFQKAHFVQRVGRMEEHGETSTVEHLFTTDELTIEIRKARPKVSTLEAMPKVSILEAKPTVSSI